MKESLTRLGIADQYTFDRPAPVPETVALNDFAAINFVFNNPVHFNNLYDALNGLGNGYGYLLAMDDKARSVRFPCLLWIPHSFADMTQTGLWYV